MATPPLRIMFVGDVGVGKTCLANHLVRMLEEDVADRTTRRRGSRVRPTELVTMSSVRPNGGMATGDTRRVVVVDTPGGERHRCLLRMLYAATDVVVLVYDGARAQDTLTDLATVWTRDMERFVPEATRSAHMRLALVGTHADAAGFRQPPMALTKALVAARMVTGQAAEHVCVDARAAHTCLPALCAAVGVEYTLATPTTDDVTQRRPRTCWHRIVHWWECATRCARRRTRAHAASPPDGMVV
jgi:GTPase SAR1 family protein